MSEPIGVGDWVECIQNRKPTTQPPIGLVVGRAYRVEAAGVTGADDDNPNTPWIRVEGARCRPDKLGFRAAWFKPIPRPSESLFLTRLMDVPADPEKVMA